MDLGREIGADLAGAEHQRAQPGLGARDAATHERRHEEPPDHAAKLPHKALALVALAAAGCVADLDASDGVFYPWDGRRVHCAVGLDDSTYVAPGSIDRGLDRARDRAEVVELYGHAPGRTMAWDTLEYVLAGAVARDLEFLTYAELAHDRVRRPAIALSFDDHHVQTWTDARALLARHGAKVTFFVSRYARLDDGARAQLRELAGDGHAIEAHSVQHLRAPRYVEAHGVAAYLANEAVPSIEALRADGYDVTSYAYPFGARTGELDDALLALPGIATVRSLSFSVRIADDPCPH